MLHQLLQFVGLAQPFTHFSPRHSLQSPIHGIINVFPIRFEPASCRFSLGNPSTLEKWKHFPSLRTVVVRRPLFASLSLSLRCQCCCAALLVSSCSHPRRRSVDRKSCVCARVCVWEWVWGLRTFGMFFALICRTDDFRMHFTRPALVPDAFFNSSNTTNWP